MARECLGPAETGSEPDLAVLPSIAEMFGVRYPSRWDVEAVAGQFTGRPVWEGAEGPQPRLVISPGMVAVEAPDLAKRERTWERAVAHHARAIDQAALADEIWTGDKQAEIAARPPGDAHRITGWSSRSRNRFRKVAGSVDYTPMIETLRTPTLLTWTLPAEWRKFTPDERAWKRLVKVMRRRWERAWDGRLPGVWKNEYQQRGAPHLAAWTVAPEGLAGAHRRVAHEAALVTWEASGRAGRRPYYRAAVGDGLPFRQWQKLVWNDVVFAGVEDYTAKERRDHLLAGANDDHQEGLKCKDPRRLITYLLKEGTAAGKEYQNVPPKGWRPGRYWGYWEVRPARVEVALTAEEWLPVVRVLRRWSRAQGVTYQVRPDRYRRGRVESAYPDVIGLAGALLMEAYRPRKRKVRRRARYMRGQAGFLLVNDGPVLALPLARYLVQ